jgi:hypothetical protein
VRVLTVLKNRLLGEGRRQGDLAAVFSHGAAQGAHRVVALAACRVIPARNGADCDLEIAAGHGMRPGLLSQAADRLLE